MLIHETPRCRLRPIESKDVPALLRNFSDPDVMRYCHDMTPLADVADVGALLAFWELGECRGTLMRWAIALKEDDRLIGTCGLHDIDRERGVAAISHELHPEHWRRGLLSEVLPLLLDYAFEDLALRRVSADIDARNRGAIALAKKFGFRHETMPPARPWLRAFSAPVKTFRLTAVEYARRRHAYTTVDRRDAPVAHA